MRKAVYGVSDQVRQKPDCTTIEEISKLGNRGDCAIYLAKSISLNSCMVTAKLICAFTFTYANIRFSHDAAHL